VLKARGIGPSEQIKKQQKRKPVGKERSKSHYPSPVLSWWSHATQLSSRNPAIHPGCSILILTPPGVYDPAYPGLQEHQQAAFPSQAAEQHPYAPRDPAISRPLSGLGDARTLAMQQDVAAGLAMYRTSRAVPACVICPFSNSLQENGGPPVVGPDT